MLGGEKAAHYNTELMERLAEFLNLRADAISAREMAQLKAECGVSEECAWSVLLAYELGLDISGCARDRELYEMYFPKMVHRLDAAKFRTEPYYADIHISELDLGRWKFRQEHYKPYEAFVSDDLIKLEDGRILPQIGFFDCEFSYPAVLEDNREWMLVTPNEINTMRKALRASRGRVLTYGLGLGYYAYTAALKKEVASVTVVERDEQLISLFLQYILPQFAVRDKIEIVQADAFEFAATRMARGSYDLVFTDIWHDAADGVELYLKMKQYEHLSPKSEFAYWIEPTLKCYIKEG